MNKNDPAEKIAIIGLGYVGLPVALAIAKKFSKTIGFDISKNRIDALKNGFDWSGEQSIDEIKNAGMHLTDQTSDLYETSFFIVTVPTPITDDNKPDLIPILSACETVGAALKNSRATRAPVIVFESTVYPGLTEELCAIEIARHSGKIYGKDFFLGYSPERINPGDPVHKLESIIKVIAGDNADTLQRLENVYGAVIHAGLHKAPSIAVAEAAKVLENTQRDLNVALMNELALICEKLDIRTKDVLDAAGTKWNFLKFTPGLVGGHCIGVDPYYLTTRAQSLGYEPEVILAGRRINDSMGQFIADKAMRWLAKNKPDLKNPRIGIMGLTFKENIRDLRNSRVPDIVNALKEKNVTCLIHDPMVDKDMAAHEYDITMSDQDQFKNLDVLILAVPHKQFLSAMPDYMSCLNKGGFFIDIKSMFSATQIDANYHYWSL
jgi:UDP-N-acetyl-D-galactosamine dehydrogenase